MAPVRKVPRVKPIVDRVDFGTEKKEAQESLQAAVSNFYAGKSVDHYMASVLLDHAAIDPNAFCLVTFDQFDPRSEKAQPYPTLVGCEDAWNFEYRNGDLEWLMVHRAIKYKSKQAPQPAGGNPSKASKADKAPTGKKSETVELDGNWFCMYLPNDQVVFKQIDPGTVSTTLEHVLVDAKGRVVMESAVDGVTRAKEGLYYYRVSSVELYEVAFYQQKSGEVQAFRIGFRPDAETNGRTCVNFWHSALPFMLKGIKARKRARHHGGPPRLPPEDPVCEPLQGLHRRGWPAVRLQQRDGGRWQEGLQEVRRHRVGRDHHRAGPHDHPAPAH
jgi:hypothetical protein